PILHHLLTNRRRPKRKTCRVLVLSPTRELSGQILDSFRAYGRHVGTSAVLVIGGVSMGAQVRAVQNGVDVLVATPGRLLDLVTSNALRFGDVEFLVLDEADRMLDMGFIHDIRRIVAKLPAQRQTFLFSATMPRAIGISAHAIHGNKSQNQRERVLSAFRKGKVLTLIATDIAARGIDVEGISHVVNFDLPNVPETYCTASGALRELGQQASRSRSATAKRRRTCATSRS